MAGEEDRLIELNGRAADDPELETTWLRMTFDVLVPCPAALPVEVNLRYAQAEKVAVTPIGGFADLGDVSYTGCSAGPG